jgi:translation elongation factor EF-Tu-like GTPase
MVQLKMKASGAGGRICSFTEGYRPHFRVVGSDVQFAVTAVLCPGAVAPGDEAEVEFEFDYPTKVDYSPLAVGAEIEMLEGSRAYATGTILKRDDHAA